MVSVLDVVVIMMVQLLVLSAVRSDDTQSEKQFPRRPYGGPKCWDSFITGYDLGDKPATCTDLANAGYCRSKKLGSEISARCPISCKLCNASVDDYTTDAAYQYLLEKALSRRKAVENLKIEKVTREMEPDCLNNVPAAREYCRAIETKLMTEKQTAVQDLVFLKKHENWKFRALYLIAKTFQQRQPKRSRLMMQLAKRSYKEWMSILQLCNDMSPFSKINSELGIPTPSEMDPDDVVQKKIFEQMNKNIDAALHSNENLDELTVDKNIEADMDFPDTEEPQLPSDGIDEGLVNIPPREGYDPLIDRLNELAEAARAQLDKQEQEHQEQEQV